MKKTKLAVTLTTTALLAGEAVCAENSRIGGANATDLTPAAVQAATLAGLSKAEMRKLLSGIAQAKEPEPEMGAMCYSPMAAPDRIEYVCPTCGEKTLYRGERATLVNWELADCRRIFKTLPKREAMVLNEAEFCRKCCPKVDKPQLSLVIRFADGTSNTVRGVTSEDLRLLAGALAGKLTAQTINDGEEPLKDKLPRLRELLGIKE